jgi:hypothetical protein
VNDADADPTNELNTGLALSGTSIQVTDAGGTLSQDLNGTFATDAELAALSVNDADADPANELNTGISFDGTNLTITDAGGNQTIDISGANIKSITPVTGDINLNITHYTVLLNVGVYTNGVILPAPGPNLGRIYVLRNNSGIIIPITGASSTPSIPNNSAVWLQSDGVIWQQIN